MKAIAWLPALAGAAVSVGLSHNGFAGFLFLLPLGLVAWCCNPPSAWCAAALAAAGNVLWLLVAGVSRSQALPWADMLYLTALIAVFAWITAPPVRGGGFLRISAVYRIAAGGALSSLVLALSLHSAGGDQDWRSLVRPQAEFLASLYAGASGADEALRSLTEHYLTADAILDMIGAVALRGGMVVSCVALLAASRQLSLLAAALVRRKRPGGSLAAFHLRPECIWALSFSLLAILAGLNFGIAPLEIAGWNILVLCGILYLAQGVGIAIFFLGRLPPGMRFALNLGLAALVLSPGINAVVLGALILLGIAENWAPFRAPKSDGPPPTPGA